MADFSLPNYTDNNFVKFLNNSTQLNDENLNPIKSKIADVILPNMSLPEIPILNENENLEIKLKDFSQIYTTGEDRARVAKFTDPLNLNFKVFVDFSREAGLVADESYVNSALAYLKRIGEFERYEKLKIWIKNLRILLSDYDFLFEEVEGLDIIQNQKPGQFFVYSQEKIKIQFRETLDMYIQSLIVTYHHICFDKIRGVSVLPPNLRKLDIYVLVYAAGYYNMILHDVVSDETLDHLVLPTKRKLSSDVLNLETLGEFNYTLYEIKNCEIDAESGSQFISTVSNEMSSEPVKNNITFKYKFATFSGAYNNLMGSDNFYSVLAMGAAANKLANQHKVQQFTDVLTDTPNNSKGNIFQKFLDGTDLDEKLVNSYKQFTDKNTYKNIFQNIKKDTINKLDKIVFKDLPNKLLGANSVIGRTLSKFTPQYAALLLQNTIDKGISKGVQNLIDNPITKINNLLLKNYSDDLVDLYKNLSNNHVNKNLEVIENPPRTNVQNKEYSYEIGDNYQKPNTLKESNENIYDGNISPLNPNLEINTTPPKYTNPIKVTNENIYSNKNKGNKNMYVRRGF